MIASPGLLQAWLRTRPPSIQKLAAEFPLETEIPRALTAKLGPEHYYVFGYTEDDHLIIAHGDPNSDYEKVAATRQYLCAQHMRDFKHD